VTKNPPPDCARSGRHRKREATSWSLKPSSKPRDQLDSAVRRTYSYTPQVWKHATTPETATLSPPLNDGLCSSQGSGTGRPAQIPAVRSPCTDGPADPGLITY